MDYCGPLGIPYEEFLAWGDLSQEAALDWSVRNRSRCPSCGTPPVDWDEARGGDRAAYFAELTHCLGCQQLDALEVPQGQNGVRRQMIPNDLLRMWGGPFATSGDIPRGARDDRGNLVGVDRLGADAGDAERGTEGDPA